jgi:hypothetical protein
LVVGFREGDDEDSPAVVFSSDLRNSLANGFNEDLAI